MTNVQFKAGDKVYFPTVSTSVLILKESDKDGRSYPFEVIGYTFTKDGKLLTSDIRPSLFHATEENRKKLQDFYGERFEEPRIEPPNAKIVKGMIANGFKFIICYVSDTVENPDHNCRKAIVSGYDESSLFPFMVEDEAGWKYATPIDNHGNRITEL